MRGNVRIKEVSILIQICLGVLAIIWAIFSIYESRFLSIAEFCLGFSLLFMAYNNKKIYKRKYATVSYLILGIVLLLMRVVLIS